MKKFDLSGSSPHPDLEVDELCIFKVNALKECLTAILKNIDSPRCAFYRVLVMLNFGGIYNYQSRARAHATRLVRLK